MPDVKKENPAHVGKCAVLFLLSGFWLLTTINGSYRDFSFIDKILILSLSVLICGFQMAFLLMVTRIELLTRVYNMFFAIFAVVNLFCLYLFLSFPLPYCHRLSSSSSFLSHWLLPITFFVLYPTMVGGEKSLSPSPALYFYLMLCFLFIKAIRIPRWHSTLTGTKRHLCGPRMILARIKHYFQILRLLTLMKSPIFIFFLLTHCHRRL